MKFYSGINCIYLILTTLLLLLTIPVYSSTEALESATELLQKDPEKAIELLIQLEKSPESLESSIFLGDIFFAKAKAYKNLEEFGKVEEQSAKAIKLYEKAKAFKKSNTTKNWLAKAIYQNGQAEEAVKIYNQVILQSIERKDTSSLIDSKTDLLSLHYNLANFDRCTKIAYELIELKKNYSLPLIEEIKIFNILGNINSVNENTPKAIEYYQKAHIAATKINNHYVLTFINFNLAILYHNEEKLALTERYYLKSLEASNLSEKPYAKAFASLKFAHYLIEKDSALIDAKKHLKDCITHFSKEKRYSYESYGLGLLGVTELRLGNRDAGLLKFDEVEKLIPKNPNKRHLSILLGHMAEDCDKANFHKRAYKYQKLKEELDKEIFDEESQNELLQLQTDYEIKEKELEISTLKQKNTDQSLIGFLLFAFIAALLIFSFFLWRQRHTLRAKNQELDIAKEKAEHLAKSKAEFLATMSHEIRTPMNGVIGMANILEDENLCPNQKENLEILKFSADNLLHLINDILDISKIDSGKIILEQKEFDLESHFKKLFSIFTTANKNSDLNLNLDIQLGDLKNLVIGDTLRLNQVISNLINNALKFTKEGSISLHIKTVKQFSEKVKVKFEVIDTGIGISPENQKAIFKKFQQAENETSRLYGGTGLGLNIAKEIIALHDSDLQLKSQLGKGSNFFFEIDFSLSQKENDKACNLPTKSETPDISGMKILLAEDNKVNQIVAKRLLKKWDINLTIAENGAIAVDLFKSNEFDLILMDIQMPEMDGFEATKRIRKLPNGDLPIFSMSASTFSSKISQQDKNLLDGHIGKPFNPDELHKMLCKHIPSVEKTSVSSIS